MRLFLKCPAHLLQIVIQQATKEIGERYYSLLEVYSTEWSIIGRMKKQLNRFIDSCRICWKKVKVPDLVEHSKLCELNFRIRDELKELEKKFLKIHIDLELFFSEREIKQNIGSM